MSSAQVAISTATQMRSASLIRESSLPCTATPTDTATGAPTHAGRTGGCIIYDLPSYLHRIKSCRYYPQVNRTYAEPNSDGWKASAIIIPSRAKPFIESEIFRELIRLDRHSCVRAPPNTLPFREYNPLEGFQAKAPLGDVTRPIKRPY